MTNPCLKAPHKKYKIEGQMVQIEEILGAKLSKKVKKCSNSASLMIVLRCACTDSMWCKVLSSTYNKKLSMKLWMELSILMFLETRHINDPNLNIRQIGEILKTWGRIEEWETEIGKKM